ncbi:unnamed protein product [Heligmosomoides polygyrus]|uniref:G_PROTEIN_RECEP_F1_2 domain-containing protein n=1 Tax=Heligmosomoides polygyrus TaxID=6339 RepID=A0A183G6A3_HELPZ|nr:unnamed protein product [Heligmosomoides polygyrus]
MPNEAFKAQIYAEFPEIDTHAFAGMSVIHSSNDYSRVLGADFVIMTVALACIGVYCAVRIHLHLKQSGLSPHTACPTLLLCFPASSIHVILMGEVRTCQLVTDGLGVLTSLYSLFNPLVTMLSVTDYRRYLLSLFVSRKTPSTIHSVLSTSRIAMAWMKKSAGDRSRANNS